jgi:UDP-2,3-diacylglucosamine pyrophosphatase LpxH
MRKMRVFISDAHMSAKDLGPYQHNFHWLSERQIGNLSSFLNTLVARKPDELVLLGDLLDNWVCPHDMKPPSMADILHAPHNQPIVDALNAVMRAGVKVMFVWGNHDQLVTAADLQQVMPGLVVTDGWHNDSVYRDARIHAEHGSSRAMFNAPDPIHDRRSRLPLGYFMTRVTTTRAAKTGKTGREYATYLDDIMEMSFTSQRLAASVFEAVLEEAGVPETASIAMPGNTSITVREVKDRYADLYDHWCATHKGFAAGIRAIISEFNYLDDMADQLCKRGGTNIVVLGHSHKAEIDKDTWFVDDRIYANAGAWCEKETSGTFVEVETTDKEQNVRVRDWDGKDARTLFQESVARSA